MEELRPTYRRAVIAIEGVYSMDGDIPDVPQFVEIKQRHKCFLYIDEAHSLGVLGAGPWHRGAFWHSGRDVDLWMGTLSKSLGSCGGYLAGSRRLDRVHEIHGPRLRVRGRHLASQFRRGAGFVATHRSRATSASRGLRERSAHVPRSARQQRG